MLSVAKHAMDTLIDASKNGCLIIFALITFTGRCGDSLVGVVN